MTLTVSLDNQPLQPLLIGPEPSRYCKVAKIALIALAGFAIGGAASMALNVSLVIAGAVGAVAGLVLGIAIVFFFKESAPLVQYRIQTLEQLEKVLMNPKQMEVIQALKKQFKELSLNLEFHYELHTLHDRLTFLTDEIRVRPNIHKVWKEFLDNLKGVEIFLPDSSRHLLDCTTELNRLESGKIPEEEITTKDYLNPLCENDLEQVYNLEIECFGKNNILPKEELKKNLLVEWACLLARHKQEILGFALIHPEKNDGEGFTLSGLGRKASAARLGIGEKLLKAVNREFEKFNLYLQVRESNASAIHLYTANGFSNQRTLLGYYREPRENGYLMLRPAAEPQVNIA